MPKMKTHSGVAKRFKKTGGGNYKRYQAYKSHLTSKKSPARKRRLRKSTLVKSADVKRINQFIK